MIQSKLHKFEFLNKTNLFGSVSISNDPLSILLKFLNINQKNNKKSILIELNCGYCCFTLRMTGTIKFFKKFSETLMALISTIPKEFKR